MDTIELRNSKGYYSLIAILASISIIFGVISLINGYMQGLIVIGYVPGLIVIPLGIGLFVFLRHLFDNEPRIILDEEGITDNTLWVGKILWSDIQGARLRSILGQSFISLELDDEEKYLRKLSSPVRTLAGSNTLLGFERLNINLLGVASDENKILQIILERSAKHNPPKSATKRV